MHGHFYGPAASANLSRNILRPMAMARPARIVTPVRTGVTALSKPDVFDHWQAGIRAAGAIGQNVITIYDVIGEDFWTGGGVTVNRIDAALRTIGNQPVELHVNSPGGDMFEGIAIYNRLQEHPAKITAKIMGLAASAASILIMAADEILIGPASFIMIHNCWVTASGDRNDFSETSSFLAPFDQAMADVYATRTGKPASAVAAMMDAETWFSGKQAIDDKFADGMLKPEDMKEDEAASASARSMNAVRQAEHGLIAAGSSRREAQALISKIRGQRDASPPGVPRDVGSPTWLGQAASLLASMRT